MLKPIITAVFCCMVFFCSAQKQLLTYPELQSIVQNNPDQITIFLKGKNYQILPGSNNNNLHFLGLVADEDYTDITISFEKRHTIIHLTTTNQPQVAVIQKYLQSYNGKNSKGSTIYRVKDGAFSTIAIKENEPKVNSLKVYNIDLEN
ncbi:MAG: hypothetical protein V5804_01020 [Mucilaginibacter sp.]|uniref:hypothetical protein n=1 Tax=Mucilaginibacter sp. TaxID=1882438 RepID=UPI0034E554E9